MQCHKTKQLIKRQMSGKEESVNLEVSGEVKSLQSLEGENFDNLFKKKEVLFNLVSQSIDMKPKAKKLLVYMGTFLEAERVDDEGVIHQAYSLAKFVDANRDTWHSGGYVIVKAVKNIPVVSTVEITYLGEEKITGKKSVKKYVVTQLQ